jgi:dTDP-4-dehydrorhamnose reductase
MKKSVYVFGSTGMLGTAMKELYEKQYPEYNLVLYSRKDVDATDPLANEKLLELSKSWPENSYIINCIGLIPQKGKYTNKVLCIVFWEMVCV